MFGHPEFDDHEQVLFARDPAVGLRAIVALHSTAPGPAFGGCRMWAYASEADALTDALRLSRGMTYKAAICGLPLGGGKSVIIGDPRRDKTRELLLAMGRVVEGLGGRYAIADDIGTTLDDLRVMREVTPHTAAATPSAQQPLAVTAYGVLMAIRAAVGQRFGRDDLAGLKVAVQGLGNVGFPLCGHLYEAGAELVVSDIDPARIASAESAFGARGVAADAIYEQEVDVFAPCALGAILNQRTIRQLGARIVCGGANNQLAAAGDDAALAARGILYVPDYLANAGGVIDFHQEVIDDRPEAVLRAVGRIREIAERVLNEAAAFGRTPLQVADAIVRQRLQAAAEARPLRWPRSPGLASAARMRHDGRSNEGRSVVLLEGSCHCGAVKFRLRSPHPYPFNLCYCSVCRKTAGGGGFAINLGGEAESLEVDGREHLRVYRAKIQDPEDAEPHHSLAERHFCASCGSALWLWDPRWPELIHPFASAIDTALPAPPERTHLMLEFKAPWVEPAVGPNDKRSQRYPEESIAAWHERLGLVRDG